MVQLCEEAIMGPAVQLCKEAVMGPAVQLCEEAVPYTHAWMDSVTEPIWLTLSRRQLQAFFSHACWMRLGFVTVRSSPTTWISTDPVNLLQFSQSSWSNGSSMDWTAEKPRPDAHKRVCLCTNQVCVCQCVCVYLGSS